MYIRHQVDVGGGLQPIFGMEKNKQANDDGDERLDLKDAQR